MDPCPVLIGREQEMASLRALLDAGGGVAIVSGEAGIGKSRLVREFAAEAASRGRVVLWGRPEEVAQPGPYALIVDLLESIAELGDSNTKNQSRELSFELMRISGDEQRPAPAARAVAAEIRGLSSQLGMSPLIILEDLHWADEASHSVVLHLARAAPDDGHAVVCTYRTEGLDTSVSLPRLVDSISRERGSEAVALGPLSDHEVSSMIEVIAPKGLDDVERARIAQLGEGVPFFIEELASAAASGGPPRTLELTVNSRLRGLTDEGVEVVRLASLLLGAIDSRVVAYALELPPGVVSKHLVEAVALGLMADREGKLLFRHSLIRDAVVRGIVSVQLSEMHRKLATAIEKLYSDDLELHSSTLARHYQEAGDKEAAARFLVIAGDRALALAATEEARSSFIAAQQLSPSTATNTKKGLGEVALREGDEEKAAALFRAVADDFALQGDVSGAAHALGRLAWALRSKAESTDVITALDQGLELVARDHGEREHVELLVQKGQMLSFLFARFSEAKPILEKAMKLAGAVADDALVAQASDGLAQVADWAGDIDSAIQHGKEAIERALSSRSAEVIGRTHNNHAVKLASYGRPREGRLILLEGRTHLLQAYGAAGVSALDVSQAWIAWLMGLPGEVASLTALGQAAWQRWRGYRRILEVWAAVEQGQFKLAEGRLAAAWNDVGDSRERILAQAEHADYETRQVLFAEGLFGNHSADPVSAVKTARALVSIDSIAGGELFDSAQGLVLLASALIRAGQVDEAAMVVDQMETSLHPIDRYPYLRSHAYELHGLLERAKGDPASAGERFKLAVQSFEACSNESDRARCQRQAAEALVEGDAERGREEAIELLRDGRALCERCGAMAERNRIEAALRELGVRSRAGRPRRSDKGELSPREAEVAVLVAAGVTNSEIARELFLSERTVQDHISNGLRKLGLSGRAALAAWAARKGLV